MKSPANAVADPGIVVTSLLDDGSRGTLRWAVQEANQHPGEDVISFDPATFSKPQTITLTEGPLHLVDSAQTTITGPAAGLTISGDNKSQVFVVGAGLEVTEVAAKALIANLTISKGHTSDVIDLGGGVFVRGGASLTLIGCLLRDNAATHLNGGGGGIFNHSGTLVVMNCTLTHNEGFEGGAIKNYAGEATVINCTIVGNSSENTCGGIYTNGFNRARTRVSNCLFANNEHGDLFFGDGLELTGDFNITGDNSSPGTFSRTISDVRLGPLGRHGGPTETYSLMLDSPAKDTGDNDRLPSHIRTDQRGLPRVVNGAIDIGAFEVQ